MSAQPIENRSSLPLHVRILAEELTDRKRTNERFSLRAFARALDLHPSSLSRIMSGNQELSLKAAALVLSKLELTPERQTAFITSLADEKREKAIELLSQEMTALGKPPVSATSEWTPPRLPAEQIQTLLQH